MFRSEKQINNWTGVKDGKFVNHDWFWFSKWLDWFKEHFFLFVFVFTLKSLAIKRLKEWRFVSYIACSRLSDSPRGATVSEEKKKRMARLQRRVTIQEPGTGYLEYFWKTFLKFSQSKNPWESLINFTVYHLLIVLFFMFSLESTWSTSVENSSGKDDT